MKIKIEENPCIIKPHVTHSRVQCEILYSIWTALALLHFCTFEHISLLCTFKQLYNTYTTICKAEHNLLWWLMIIWVKKKMLDVQAKKEYAHFNHRRCANVQKYMSVDDQLSKKKLLNWCWREARLCTFVHFHHKCANVQNVHVSRWSVVQEEVA